MKKDEMYLENLDEFINDENRIVTYKWLSRTLCVHCNIAKQMLYKFIQKEQKKGGLTVTYFVSGVTKPDEQGSQVLKCSVVPEEKLDSCKKSLAELTSCHVYSVQKCKLKDSNALFMTDYEKFKENVFESNKYSSIQNKAAELRSQDDMDLLTMNARSDPEPEKKSTNGSTSSSSKPSSKKQPQSAIASMFSKADGGKKNAGKETDVKVKEEPAKEAPSKGAGKGGKAKVGGMMANFFTKQPDKKPDTKPAEKAAAKPSKKPSPEKKVSPAGKAKKTSRQEDSDDEEVQSKSKRRRIKPDLFDSSSDEDEEEDMEEDESPIPPTPPPKEPSPEPEPKKPREASPDVEVVKNEEPKTTSPQKTTSPRKESKESAAKGSNSGERKRRRVRREVKKTYMDKDGFMVTEKAWESDSTDASEAEEPVKKQAKEPAKPAAQAKGKKSPQKKPSPGKKGGGGGKQTSLMSFFKKS